MSVIATSAGAHQRTVPLGWLLQGVLLTALVCAVVVAFVPVYTASKRASGLIIDDLRLATRDRIRLDVGSFFQAPMDQISTLSGLSRFVSADWDDSTFTHFQPLVRAMALSSSATGRLTYAGLVNGGVAAFLSLRFSGGEVRSSLATVMGRRIVTSLAPPLFSNVSAVTNNPNTGTYDPTTRGWYTLLRMGQAWTGVYMDTGLFPVVTCGAPLYLAGSDTVLGAVAIDYPSSAVSAYMRNLTIGRTGRAVLLDAATQSVWGANFNYSSTMNESDTGLRLTEYRDLTDATLVKVRDELGVEWPFLAGARSAVVANRAMSRGAVYVDVVPITDEYGLDMRLLLAMPEADFAAPFWNGAVLSVAVTCGVSVVLIAVLMLLLRYISSGLARVVARLHAAAYLDVGGGSHGSASSDPDEDDAADASDDDDATPNVVARRVAEMVRIEEAFTVLRGELAHIKGFLPAHILAAAAAAKRGDVDDASSIHVARETPRANTKAALQSSQERMNTTRRSASSRFSFHSASSGGPSRTATVGVLSGAGGPRQPGGDGLRTRRVTVAVANTWRFYEALAPSMSCDNHATPDVPHGFGTSVMSAHAATLRRIEHAARRTGGSVDSCVGDMMYVSWNAATACATHRSAGAEFACRVTAEAQQSARLISVGVASSPASLGVVGSHRVKRFAIIGPCVGQAAQLERLCRAFASSAAGAAAEATPAGRTVLTLSNSGRGAGGSPRLDTAVRPLLVLNLLGGSVFEASQHDVAAVPLDIVRITAGSATHAAGSAQPSGVHLSVVATALPMILQDFEPEADVAFDGATEASVSTAVRRPGGDGRRKRRGRAVHDEEWMYTVDGAVGDVASDATCGPNSGRGAAPIGCEDGGLPPHYALALRHTGLAFFALAAAAADPQKRVSGDATTHPLEPASRVDHTTTTHNVVARARTHLKSAAGLAKRAVQLPTGPAGDAIRHTAAVLDAALGRLELLTAAADADADWARLLEAKALDPAVVFAP